MLISNFVFSCRVLYVVYLMCVWTWWLCFELYGSSVMERVLVRGVRVWCDVSCAIWMMGAVQCVVFWAGVGGEGWECGVVFLVRFEWCVLYNVLSLRVISDCTCCYEYLWDVSSIEMWSVFFNMCWSAIVTLLNKQMLFYMVRYFWLQCIIYYIYYLAHVRVLFMEA